MVSLQGIGRNLEISGSSSSVSRAVGANRLKNIFKFSCVSVEGFAAASTVDDAIQ